MKPWIKRTLVALTGTTVLLGGLTACGHRHDHHAGGWSDERVAEVRVKVIERISDKMDLNDAQRQKLGALADEIVAQRKTLRGDTTDPRAEFRALVAGDKFDRTKAQALVEQKVSAVQGGAPKVLAALADFYDSLNPTQQQQVRERLDGSRSRWWRG